MEQRYQGRWDENMMSDYCWTLKRDLPQEKVQKEKCRYEGLSDVGECVIIQKIAVLLEYSRKVLEQDKKKLFLSVYPIIH